MVKINLNGNEFELKYTLESWKKLKEKHGITPGNFQQKIGEDFAECVSGLIYYGLNVKDRESIKVEEIDQSVGFEVTDLIVSAISESMPKGSPSSQGGEDPGKK